MRPIANEYCEGKVKRTPSRGSEIVPETIRLQAVGASQDVTACLCIMILRVTVTGEVECHETRSRSESEPEEGAQSVGVDAETK